MIERSTIVQKLSRHYKSIIAAVIGLLVGFMISMGFSSCHQQDIEVIVDQKTIAEDVTRSKTEVVEDLEQQLKEKQSNYDKILKDLESLQAKLTAFQTISAKTPGKIVSGVKSDVVVPSEILSDVSPTDSKYVLDPSNYLSTKQILWLTEPIGKSDVKIGEVSFSGYSPTPWDYKILPKKYTVTTVLGETESGKQVAYNTFTVEVDGKKYNVPVEGVLQQEKNKDQFYWWNPKLGIGLSSGISNKLDFVYSGGVFFSPMSYGEKKNPTILIGQVGLGYYKSPELIVSPVALNLGKLTNFTHNTYVGPQLHTNFNTYSLQFGLMVTF